MCNYSTYAAETRDAVKGERLVAERGGLFDGEVAVCLKPGTELGFDQPIEDRGDYVYTYYSWTKPAGFKEQVARACIDGAENFDALEFADGSRMLMCNLSEGQKVRVLQLPVSVHAHVPELVP